MDWPKEKYPLRTQYAFIEFLRKLKFRKVIFLLLIGYFVLNLLFSGLHFFCNSLQENATSEPVRYFDYFYFSFISGTTIGFGDFYPLNDTGKIITIFQSLLSTLYFALMVSFLGVKALFPNHTLHFSDKIVFNGDQFIFRILNSHRGLLVNPEIRIAVVAHCSGNVIAPTIPAGKVDDLHWLDNHDFSVGFYNNPNNSLCISEEWEKAKSHQGVDKSRFKIRISVSGSYGMQQYTQVVSYDKNDIVRAKKFKAIKYCDEDKRKWRNIRFKKYGDFWKNFNTVEKD